MNAAQIESLNAYKAYNVPASWFIAEEPPTCGEDGDVEVIALGDGFIWSLLIDTEGNVSSSEAKVDEFSTGIEV